MTATFTRTKCIAVCFGTRPEVIKFAPVVHRLRDAGADLVVINSGQHSDLLAPLLEHFDVRPTHTLQVMRAGQSLNALGSRLMEQLDPVLEWTQPDALLVQGDTATALAGAMAGFNRKVPVGHLEAGLRSGDALSPFPEEMNRRLITQLAHWHFAATESNARVLKAEGIDTGKIHLTGNTVIDALHQTLERNVIGSRVRELIDRTAGRKIVLMTTHRRENFGDTMTRNLRNVRAWIERNEDLALVFPVHPNPNVQDAVAAELAGHSRIILTKPLDYPDFVQMLSRSWLIVSDSGGVQEEATALGRPMIILRENTERPEAVESGVARLVGECPDRLAAMLETALTDAAWFAGAGKARHTFGDGQSAARIASILMGANAVAVPALASAA